MTKNQNLKRNFAHFLAGLAEIGDRVGPGSSYHAGRVIRDAANSVSDPEDLELLLKVRGTADSGVEGSNLDFVAVIDRVEQPDPRQIMSDDTPGSETVQLWNIASVVTGLKLASEASCWEGNGIREYSEMLDDFVLSLSRNADGDLGVDPRISNDIVHEMVTVGHLRETEENRYCLTEHGLHGYLDQLHLRVLAGVYPLNELMKRVEFLEGVEDASIPVGNSQDWSFDNLPHFVETEPSIEELRERIWNLEPETILQRAFPETMFEREFEGILHYCPDARRDMEMSF
ncbi:hypothetical protein [Salipiger mucosus]|uniref:Uncharacterized protein n=1 Tax=Salipiger mucosus DSM 16094 TaxID=1123237 RepID=S9QWR8_9RHOB|nr:hypothetical protein [Salipiger mucosus]EPX84048.1 hypothetical protein Salmuc_01823 [Salipiger mucosus DSM 16094]